MNEETHSSDTSSQLYLMLSHFSIYCTSKDPPCGSKFLEIFDSRPSVHQWKLKVVRTPTPVTSKRAVTEGQTEKCYLAILIYERCKLLDINFPIGSVELQFFH